MKITEILTKETIHLNLSGTTKPEAIDQLVAVLDRAGKLKDVKEFKAGILKREEQSTTGIGEGIAIPHAKTKAVKTASIAFGKSVNGIDYDSLDGQPAHLFFMIAAPEGANNTHLEALARLSTILMKSEVREALLNANTERDVLNIIDQYDKEEEKEGDEETMSGEKKFIVAVTACPTGIAHTYMAADSLKAKAAELGVDIKVETRGSGGAKNVLTPAEIEKAVAVIVAADTNVETDRFNGKHVIETKVADGIRKPKELIERALKQDAPIFKGSGNVSSSSEKKGQGVGATIYKHLMSGVSNMLPFVVGGGILIAISFMFGYNAFNPEDPSYHPIAEALMTIGGGSGAFGFIVPILAAFIAMSIADRPGFAAGAVGGLLANSGGAGFLGGIIAGFLAGYIVVGLKKVLTSLPASLEGIKTILLYPLLGIALTGFAMIYIVNGPVGAINTGITNWLSGLGTGNAVLLGLVLGLMMAFDMGGPINKAAYVFGTGLLANGVYEPMAAVMAAGMVPPLGIAIATTFFGKKFTKQEREAGKVNYIMGLSFITEGAIPFAAADPLRVIPSLMAGSAVAGALTMMFGIGLSAPHGGLFVVPLVDGGWFMYLIAIVAGAIISGVILGLVKKPVQE